MGIKEQFKDLEDKIALGLEEAYRKMVIFKKQKNSPMIIAKKGKIVEIAPNDIPETIKCKR
jgi:hypothetical protein